MNLDRDKVTQPEVYARNISKIKSYYKNIQLLVTKVEKDTEQKFVLLGE